jgi:hypothetical protein
MDDFRNMDLSMSYFDQEPLIVFKQNKVIFDLKESKNNVQSSKEFSESKKEVSTAVGVLCN